MKRIISAIITALVFALALTGCGENGDPTNPGGKYITGIDVTGLKTEFNVGELFSLGAAAITVNYNEGPPDIFTGYTQKQLKSRGITVDDSAFVSDVPSTAPIPIVVTFQGFSMPFTYYVTVIDPDTTVAAPVPSMLGGSFPAGAPVIVYLTCATDGAEIWYTTNGEEPVNADPCIFYTGIPVFITGGGVHTLKAKAFNDGMTPSATMIAVYTIAAPLTSSVITITVNPAAETSVFQGEINGSLTAAATVSGGGMPVYRWYSNARASNAGGTPVLSGGNAASFDIPTDLTAADSPYYYFCEVSAADAESKRSTVAAVTVNAIAVTGVSLNKNNTTIIRGMNETLVAYIEPPNATNKEVIWESGDSDRAEVINGRISILPDAASGRVQITVRTVDGGFEDHCTVTVLVPEPEFEVDGIYYKLISGTSVKVTNKLYDDEAQEGDIFDSYWGDVDIPATVTNQGITYDVITIGSRAFYGCQRLLSVTLPCTIKTIEDDNVFAGCLSLASLTLDEGLETIGANAFYNCQYLTALNIPSTVTSIGNAAFRRCIRLSITADDGGVFSADEFGVLFQSGSGENAGNPKYYLRWIPEKMNGPYVIPDGVTEICKFSVDYITALSELTIPASVTVMRTTENFRGLEKLGFIKFEGMIPPETPDGLGELSFNLRMGTTILVPGGSMEAYVAGIWRDFKIMEY